MVKFVSHTSLWELAHHWEEADPFRSTIETMPPKVLEILRLLSFAVASGRLYAVHPEVEVKAFTNGEVLEVVFHDELCAGPSRDELLRLVKCTADQELLSSLFVTLHSVFMWACDDDLPIPEFVVPPEYWVKGAEPDKPKEEAAGPANLRRSRAEFMDKATVQGAAIALWDASPEMPLAQMAKHPVIERLVGQHYVLETKRAWVSEVAPKTVSRKPGRPKAIPKDSSK